MATTLRHTRTCFTTAIATFLTAEVGAWQYEVPADGTAGSSCLPTARRSAACLRQEALC
jgi:hypothetical protein